jgi:hypothetical protein
VALANSGALTACVLVRALDDSSGQTKSLM